MGAERLRFGYPFARPGVIMATPEDIARIISGQAVKCSNGHDMVRVTTKHGKRDEFYCAICNVSKPLFNHE